MNNTKTPTPVSDEMRRIIQECGMTRYEISKLSGVQQAALSRFLSGERGLWTITLDRLFPVLGLKIVKTEGENSMSDAEIRDEHLALGHES